MGWHCAWGRVKHGTACRKKENKSGCFLLFLSVSLFFEFHIQHNPAIKNIFIYILLLHQNHIDIIYCSPFFLQPGRLGLIAADPDPQNSPLWTLQRRGGQRWDKDPDLKDQTTGLRGLRVWLIFLGGKVLLKKNQTGADDDPNI